MCSVVAGCFVPPVGPAGGSRELARWVKRPPGLSDVGVERAPSLGLVLVLELRPVMPASLIDPAHQHRSSTLDFAVAFREIGQVLTKV